MKSYKELITETLNQRHIIDNRQVVVLKDITPSVLVAFHQACLDVLNMYNWVWNRKKITYQTQAARTSYPMPYGIVKGLVLEDSDGVKCPLEYAHELTATQGCPTQWTHDWENEEIAIAPAEKDDQHTMTIEFYDKNIACIGPRSDKRFLKDFDDTEKETVDGVTATFENQFLNVPETIYNIYARCIITLTRVYLNEGSQPSVLNDQKAEFEQAKNSLLEYAKTPFYDAQRYEI
jgi:hypothetical protein